MKEAEHLLIQVTKREPGSRAVAAPQPVQQGRTKSPNLLTPRTPTGRVTTEPPAGRPLIPTVRKLS